MSILEIELTPEMEQQLHERASRQGQSAPAYAQSLLLRDFEQQENQKPKRSIMELHGIGKGTWAGVDVQQYINEMRDEWDEPA